MEEEELYFRIFLRAPQYPVIVISGEDIFPAFKTEALGNACYSLAPPGSSNKLTVIDSSGKDFYYLEDKTTLFPGIGGKKWTKKNLIELFNQSTAAKITEMHYAPKSLSNKRVAVIVNEICEMLMEAAHK